MFAIKHRQSIKTVKYRPGFIPYPSEGRTRLHWLVIRKNKFEAGPGVGMTRAYFKHGIEIEALGLL